MGAKRLNKVDIRWSPNFAYAIGLITTDGNLSSDLRHINITSKDFEVIENFKNCLGLDNKIGRKGRGENLNEKKYFVLQFGDKSFFDFLLSIGLTPAKSKTLGKLTIPKKYFSHFLRGCIDGDGTINYFSHPESKHPQLRTRLFSASLNFLNWMRMAIVQNYGINRGWIGNNKRGAYSLCYGKEDSIKLLNHVYYNKGESYLKRKYKIARQFLGEW